MIWNVDKSFNIDMIWFLGLLISRVAFATKTKENLWCNSNFTSSLPNCSRLSVQLYTQLIFSESWRIKWELLLLGLKAKNFHVELRFDIEMRKQHKKFTILVCQRIRQSVKHLSRIWQPEPCLFSLELVFYCHVLINFPGIINLH